MWVAECATSTIGCLTGPAIWPITRGQRLHCTLPIADVIQLSDISQSRGSAVTSHRRTSALLMTN